MEYRKELLRKKIDEMYPEIAKHGIKVSLDFDESKNTYLVTFKKDAHKVTTDLNKKDAEDCMNNVKCVYLGKQIGEFIKNFKSTK